MRLARTGGVILGLLLPWTGLGAQAPPSLVDRAIRAWADVDFDAAVGFLRRWFASAQATTAPPAERGRALTYLGAAEALRGNRDSAAAAFERLVVLDPRHRLDEMVFPPEVTTLYAAVRQRTKAVIVEVDPSAEFRPDSGAYAVRVIASSAHPLRAVLRQPDGRGVRVLYSGFIADSTILSWDGRDSAGAAVASGSYLLEIQSSTVLGDAVTRMLQVPLDVQVVRPDTLPHPPAPDTLAPPARLRVAPGSEALAGGIVAGAAAWVLPSLLAPGAEVVPLRFVVAGLAGGAGVIGFVRNFPGRLVAGSRQVNTTVAEAWRRDLAATIAENRTRRAAARVIVRSGEPIAVDLRTR
jgi:hypothetical protein